MHFSDVNNERGSKATKIAIVAVLHVLVGIGFVKTINSKMITMPKMPEEIMVLLQPEAPPPPPPEPPKPMPKLAPPDIVVPKVQVDIAPPPPVEPVGATPQADPAPATPGPVAPEAPAAPANTGAMRTAVLADANGCAKPEYPVRAARNGESGTVTLALLVGTDGRVAGSRIQHSSGSRELDKAAVAALSLCKFKPASNNGAPEQAWGQIAYVWTLEQ